MTTTADIAFTDAEIQESLVAGLHEAARVHRVPERWVRSEYKRSRFGAANMAERIERAAKSAREQHVQSIRDSCKFFAIVGELRYDFHGAERVHTSLREARAVVEETKSHGTALIYGYRTEAEALRADIGAHGYPSGAVTM